MSGAPAAVLRVVVDTNAGPAERKLSKFEKRLAGSHAAAKKFSHGVDLAGLALAGGITYGLVKAASAGVKFERQLSTLSAVSNASGKDLKRLENQALKLGESTLFTARQVAEAQTELAKGGLNTKQILGGGTKAALALAAAGQLELAEAAETTVNAMKLFGIEAKDAEKVADGYATAANRTTADVSDFAAAMKQGGAAVKAAGGDFNEGLTILEALAETGVKNSDAGTSMKTALVQLAAPTKKQTELQKTLNLHFFDQNGNLKKAAGLSEELRKALKGREGQERLNIAKTLAGTDGFRTLLALYEQGPSALAKLEKANEKQGTAQKVAAKQMDNFQGELEQLQGAAETLGIRIFKVMKPALEEAVKWAQALTEEVSKIFADENLTGPEKFKKAFDLVFDELIPMFEEVMTQTSEVAAENAPKAAGAFVKGWLNAGPWAKLFSAAYLYGKFGGAFGGFGRRAGADMGEGVAAGGLTGALSKGMRIAGAAAAGYFVAEFGTQVVEKITNSDILEGQSLVTSLTHGFNTSGIARTEQDHLQRAEGLNFHKSKAQLESLQAHFAATLHKIETDAAVGVGGIDKALATGLSQANETWLHGSKQWRQHTVEAMRGAVGSIKEGMDAGTIKAKEGKEAINHLLSRIHLITGKDPLGVAKGTAASFKEGNAITQQGVREWINRLDQMPKGAREKARKAMSQMLAAWAQGHPKLEQQVKNLTDFEIQKFGSANKKMRDGTDAALNHMSRKMLEKLPAFENFAETGGAAFENLSDTAAEALENIGENVQSTLKTLHGKVPPFTVKYLKSHGDGSGKKYLKKLPELQGGGLASVVPGTSTGDKHLLSLNGSPVAKVESGEGIFVGNRRMMAAAQAANEAVPRFQGGGLVEPSIGGPPGALLDVGQSAVHLVFEGAQKALAAAKAKAAASAGGGGGAGGYTGPPANMKQLGDNSYVDSHTLAVTAALDKMFGLTMSSGYRSPAHNAAIGGAPGSLHTHGSEANPGATDSVGPLSAMNAYIAYAKQHVAGLQEAMVDNYAGLGNNAHIGFFQRGGGLLDALQKGGRAADGVSIVHPKWEPEFQDWMQAAWGRARGLFGAARNAPDLFLARGLRGDMANGLEQAGTVELSPGYARGAMGGGSYGRETLLHEWAHVFQKAAKSKWEREGGAVAFSQWAGPKVFGDGYHFQWPGDRDYRGYTERVLADKGLPWVEKGQFGRQRGGQAGGILQMLQSGGAVVKKAGSILLRNGLDMVSTGGVLGNSYGESGWDTEAMEPGTHNGGLFGFTAGEKSLNALEAYAAKRGKPWGDTETQVQFMLHTLPTSMRGAMNNMSKVSDTTSYFMHEWERPENYSSLGTRIEHGQEAVKILEGAGIKGSGKAASDEHTYKEDVPAEYGGVAAGKTIHLPSVPKNLEGIAKELRKRRAEAKAYGSAIAKAESKKHPGIVQALQQNLTKLQTYIAELERARKKLRIEKAKSQFTGKLARKLANLTGFEVPIKEAERAFNMAQETATQTVELEPSEEGDTGAYLRWINQKEKPAYGVLFERANDWRNTVLSAERAAAGHWEAKGPLGGLEGGWENKIIGIGQKISADEKLIVQAQQDQRAFKKQQEAFEKKHPNAKHPLQMPDWLKKELGAADTAKEQIPMLSFKERELRSFLGKGREEFYPGGARVLDPTPPVNGTGSFEEQLENLQGIKWPRLHGKMASLPTKRSLGGFGGVVWDIQSQAEELELKMSGAIGGGVESAVEAAFGLLGEGETGGGEGSPSGPSEAEKARNEWLEEELRKANQRNAVFTNQKPIIDAYASKNFAGLFAKGGSIPAGMWGIAGEAGAEPVFGPATVVSNKDAMSAVGAAATSSNGVGRVVIEDHRIRVFDRDDKEIEAVVTKMNRQSGRRAKTIGARGAGRVS